MKKINLFYYLNNYTFYINTIYCYHTKFNLNKAKLAEFKETKSRPKINQTMKNLY